MRIPDVYYEPFVLNGGFDRLIFIFEVYEVDRIEHHKAWVIILPKPCPEVFASDVVLLVVIP